mmetsp:Transcript_111386/g.175540  ORF Transcript_111386/g.175540 Transcript_111386/m.175540 type:complete len:206 (-) Transcript_111386:25-642(-)
MLNLFPDCEHMVDLAAVRRGVWRHHLRANASAFLGAVPGETGEVPTDDPPMCFSREGNVCNKNQMTEEPDEEKAFDFRMNKLKMAEKEPWFWPAFREANRIALAEKATVESKIKSYLSSREAFEKVFESYHEEAHKWASALRGLEDDYALYCRPFHDVTMSCERKYRKALRMWFAREPLPECPVGVVVPYMKNPASHSLFSLLGS